MSNAYNLYLLEHRNNVAQAFYWLCNNLPDVLGDYKDIISDNITSHDLSKYEKDEYDAYDTYFYGGNRSNKVVENFNYAWLHHIHNNPHHWQHWLLHEDDSSKVTVMDMPYIYIIEMICDWWSFSWNNRNLFEIFDWYDKHTNIMLSKDTKKHVDNILLKIKEKLEDIKWED